jgi:DNA-binding XRE family transcriptional regulator
MAKKFRQTRFSIDMEATGNRLKEFRTSRNITIAELSARTGLSQGMISESELGRNKPSPNLMLALYRLYGVNINWLLTGEGSMIVWGKKESPGPPKDKFGKDTLDMDMLIWYAERVPLVKYSLLVHFTEYYFSHKDIIEEILKSME